MITIVSTWVNHPEVLLIHRAMWVKAFSGEPVNYIIYIDAKEYPDPSNFGDVTMKQQLIQICIENSIEYIIVPQEYHVQRGKVFLSCTVQSDISPSASDALVCQYMWNQQVLEKGVTRFLIVQTDLFPYRTFTWDSITRGAEFCYRPQQRTDGITLHYAWNGLCVFDMRRWPDAKKQIVNFDYGFHKGVFADAGAGTYYILDHLDPEQKFEFKELNSHRWSSKDAPINLPDWITEHLNTDVRNKISEDGTVLYYSEIFDNAFFHLRAGCNWDNVGRDLHDARYSRFISLISHAMNNQAVFI